MAGAASEVFRGVENVVNLVVRNCRRHQLAQASGADPGHGGRVEVAFGPDKCGQQSGIEVGCLSRVLDQIGVGYRIGEAMLSPRGAAVAA